MQEKELDKERQNKIIEDYNKMVEQQEKKRADEWAAREQRIKNAMNRMADTVLKKSNKQEKELEARVVQYANERDRAAEEREKQKKENNKKRDEEVKRTLD